MKTNIDGIYAAGDVVSYSGRVPLIALGFGEAQIAITSIMRNLFPEKTLTIHSTSI
jgi:Thioredoxin reductase